MLCGGAKGELRNEERHCNSQRDDIQCELERDGDIWKTVVRRHAEDSSSM